MTPKEQAKEIVDKFYKYMYPFHPTVATKQAKECAHFTVNLCVKYLPSSQGNPPNLQEHEGNKEYWLKVLTEIEKL